MGGRLPVLVAGADLAGPATLTLQTVQVPVDIVGQASAFPGMPASQALFVTGRNPPRPLRPVLSFVRSVFPPIDGTGERDLSADGGRLQQALGAAAHLPGH